MSEWDKLREKKPIFGRAGAQHIVSKWVDAMIAEGDKLQEELRDTNNRFGWLLDTMPVDYDDLFAEYDEDDL